MPIANDRPVSDVAEFLRQFGGWLRCPRAECHALAEFDAAGRLECAECGETSTTRVRLGSPEPDDDDEGDDGDESVWPSAGPDPEVSEG